MFYFQIDNCWKENKNTTLFGHLAFLIAQGWFCQIYLYFPPPDHTHEYIDKMHSSWNIHY